MPKKSESTPTPIPHPLGSTLGSNIEVAQDQVYGDPSTADQHYLSKYSNSWWGFSISKMGFKFLSIAVENVVDMRTRRSKLRR